MSRDLVRRNIIPRPLTTITIFIKKYSWKAIRKLGRANLHHSIAHCPNISHIKIWRPRENCHPDVPHRLASSDHQDQPPLRQHRSPPAQGEVPRHQGGPWGRKIHQSCTIDQTLYSALRVLPGTEKSVLLAHPLPRSSPEIRLSSIVDFWMSVALSILLWRTATFSRAQSETKKLQASLTENKRCN